MMKDSLARVGLNELLDFCTHHSCFDSGFFFSNLRYSLPLVEAFNLPPLVFNAHQRFPLSTGISLALTCAGRQRSNFDVSVEMRHFSFG
jgi:hypothetical protein